jgi:hypothetical protein
VAEATSSELAALAGRPLFDAGGETFTWGDAVLAAAARGDWAALEAGTRDGLACVRALTATGEELDPETVRAEARLFRYERDLLAAEELRAWRDRWGLTGAAWREHLVRRVARARFAHELDSVRAQHRVPDADVVEAVGPDAICSGGLAAAAEALAREAALAPGKDGSAGEQDATHVAALLGLDPARAAARMRELARLAEAARAAAAETATLDAVEREVASHALDWTAVEGDLLAVEDEDVAREAALCVRADGRDLADVAALCGVAVEPLRVRLGEADSRAAAAFASAREGELLGPVPWGDGYGLVLVRAKRRPHASDDETRARAEAAIADRTAARAVRERLRWHEHV